MFINKLAYSTFEAFKRAGKVVAQSFSIFRHYPEILIYPYTAGMFIAITGPLVNGLAYEVWGKMSLMYGPTGF